MMSLIKNLLKLRRIKKNTGDVVVDAAVGLSNKNFLNISNESREVLKGMVAGGLKAKFPKNADLIDDLTGLIFAPAKPRKKTANEIKLDKEAKVKEKAEKRALEIIAAEDEKILFDKILAEKLKEAGAKNNINYLAAANIQLPSEEVKTVETVENPTKLEPIEVIELTKKED